jgi:hypothetical protein
MNPSTQTTAAPKNQSFSDMKNQLENFLHTYLVQKAPVLPKGFKDFVVLYGPWITLFFLVLGGIALLFLIPVLIGASAIASATAAATGAGIIGFGMFGVLIALLITIPQMILEAMAIPGLLKRSKSKGWDLFFYSLLVGVLYNILTLSIIGLLFSLLSLYVLFQVREYYS